jgi:Tfp pilus assembly protein PilF
MVLLLTLKNIGVCFMGMNKMTDAIYFFNQSIKLIKNNMKDADIED